MPGERKPAFLLHSPSFSLHFSPLSLNFFISKIPYQTELIANRVSDFYYNHRLVRQSFLCTEESLLLPSQLSINLESLPML